MNSKKMFKRLEPDTSSRKRQYQDANDTDIDEYCSSIKIAQYDYENDTYYADDHSENEEYLEEDSDPLSAGATGSLGKSLGNWARKNQMSPESFSDLAKVLKREGVNVPDCYNPYEKKVNLQNMTAMLTVMKNQICELKEQNTGILNKMKILETQIIKCNRSLDNMKQNKSQWQSEPLNATQTMINLNHMLPVDTFEDLQVLEERLSEKLFVEEFIKTVRMFGVRNQKGAKNKRCSLGNIFGPNIVLNYNWDGSKSKKALRDLKNLNRALYEAWKGDEITHEDEFIVFLRMKFHNAKKKIHQNNYRFNKKLQEKGDSSF